MGLQRIKGKGATLAAPAEPTPPAVPPFEWYPAETLPPVAEYGGKNADDRDRPLFTIDVLALGWLVSADASRQPLTIVGFYSFTRRKWVFPGRHSLEKSGYRFECRYWSIMPPLPFDMSDQPEDDQPAAEPAPEGIDNAPAN